MNKGNVTAAFTTTGHTAVMVPVFAFGPGAEVFQGIYENCDLYCKMLGAYSFPAEWAARP